MNEKSELKSEQQEAKPMLLTLEQKKLIRFALNRLNPGNRELQRDVLLDICMDQEMAPKEVQALFLETSSLFRS